MDFLAEKRRRQQQQTGASVAGVVGTAPDKAAMARKYATELGLTPDIVLADFPRAEQEITTQRVIAATRDAPATSRFLADPAKAAVAFDDADQLVGVEKALRRPAPAPVDWQVGATIGGFDVLDFLSDAFAPDTTAGRLTRGVSGRAVNLAGGLGRSLFTFADKPADALASATERMGIPSVVDVDLTKPLGRDTIRFRGRTEEEKRSTTGGGAAAAGIRAAEKTTFGYEPGTTWEDFKASPLTSFIPFALEQGIVSAPDMVAAVTALPAYMTARTGEMGQARAGNNGLADATVEDLLTVAPAAAASAALERLGAKGIIGLDDALRGGIAGLPGAVGRAGAREALTEAGQEGIESLAETVGTERGFSAADTLNRMGAGAVAGVGYGGAVRAVTGAVEVASGQREAVQGAEQTGQFTDRLAALAEASKLRERDPASFQELVADAAAEGGYAQEVYVDRDAFNAAFSTPEGQALLAAMPETVRDAAEQAAVTGDAVKIPVDEFATYLAPSPVYAALKDHLKLDPAGMTRAEAADWTAKEGDALRAEIETRLNEQQVEGEFATSRQVVIDDIRSQLDTAGRFTSDINDIYASFAGHSISVQAARAGMTPEAFLQKHPFRVDAGDGAVLGASDTLEQGEALTRPPVEADGTVRLTHWGSKAGLKSLNPKKWGKNADILSRQERQMAEDDRLPGRVYFGIGVGREGGYVPEHGLGKHRYTASVRAEDLYDYDADPMNLRNTRVIELLAEEGFDEKPDPDGPDYGYGDEAAVAYERAIVEAGFKGFWTGEQGSGLIGVMFEKPKVNYEGEDGELGQAGRPTATLADFSPENVKDLLLKDGWAILTAANPAAQPLTDAENAAANAMLRADLDAIGAQYLEAAGKYGSEEPSFAVAGITRAQAQALGDKYRQDSVLTREGLIYGEVSGRPGVVQPALFVETYETPPADLYTEVPSTGALFKVELDWDRTIEPALEGSYAQTVSIREGRETLKRFGLNPEGRYTTRQVASALEARQRRKWGKIERDDRSPEALRKIAGWMTEEVVFEMRHPEKSGVGWYSEKFQRAIDNFAGEFEELATDQDARDLFTALIAITSDGQKVKENFAQAADLYANFKKTGKFTTDRGHIRQDSVLGNVAKIQALREQLGPRGMRDYLMQEATVSALKKAAQGLGVDFSTSYKADVKLPLSAVVFGPKLGAFYANLMGASGYLTMDRWWSRTFNRYRGSLVTAPTAKSMARFRALIGQPNLSDDETISATVEPRNSYAARGFKGGTEIERAANTIYKKAFENLEDEPFNAGDRSFMLAAVDRAQSNLKRRGYDISVADIQAILWYYEKRLYGELGASKTADTSYEDAALQVVAARTGGSRGSAADGAVEAAGVGAVEQAAPGEDDFGSYAQEVEAPPFYSALRRAVETNQTKRASAAQWLATLSKTPGVKQEEIDWTGLREWLELAGGPVERDAVLEFLDTKGIVVEEVLQSTLLLNTNSAFYAPPVLHAFSSSDRDQMIVELENDANAHEHVRYSRQFSSRWGDGTLTDDNWAEVVVDDLLAGTWRNQTRPTEFGAYALPGAEDTYKELLLTLPNIEGPETHWSVDNVVAHARITERRTPAGERVLFLEEVQSDWHQKGRDQGYGGGATPAEIARAVKAQEDALDASLEAAKAYQAAFTALAAERAAALRAVGQDMWATMAEDAARNVRAHVISQLHADRSLPLELRYGEQSTADVIATRDAYQAAALRAREAGLAVDALSEGGIPDAPFRKTWSALVMKRMIRYAVDRGFTKVAWINGNQQNGGKTGGDGSFFYERNLVNTTNDLLKKYGVKVEKIDLRPPVNREKITAERAPGEQTRREMLAEAVAEGDAAQIARAQERLDGYMEETQRQLDGGGNSPYLNAAADRIANALSRGDTETAADIREEVEAERQRLRMPATALGVQNGFTITQELANAATGGFALFQTNREAFTSWFGDSKVVDENGAPRVVYHGTGYDFDVFEGREATGWFSEDRALAEMYAERSADDEFEDGEVEPSPRVVEAYLSIQNPKIISGLDMNDESTWGEVLTSLGLDPNSGWAPAGRTELVFQIVNYSGTVRALAAQGYDGVRVTEDGKQTWLAFKPTQIKSAGGNNGNYDPANPSIVAQENRGTFTPSTNTISLLRTANLSTFLHELGHWHLETLGRMASDPNAPADVKADFDAVLAWFGITGSTPVGYAAPGGEALAQPYELFPGYDKAHRQARFDAWFKDSVVREQATGSRQDLKSLPPTVVYHGTNADITQFEAGRETNNASTFGSWTTTRAGIFFAENPAMAEGYVKRDDHGGGRRPFAAGGNILPVYLSIQKPFDLTGETLDGWNEASRAMEERGLSLDGIMRWPLAERWEAFDGEDGEAFRGALQSLGYDGVFMQERDDNGDLQDVWVVFEPTQIKSAIGNRGSFDPKNPSILAQDDTAPPVDTDLPAGRTALDVWNAMSLNQRRGYHEQFARGFEAYLFEGKAPTTRLRGVFQRFAAWLKAVYRDIARLDVELTDEVRGVMDRLVASSEEIALAEQSLAYAPLLENKLPGMTDDEWLDYQRLGVAATQGGMDELQTRALRDMKWLANARSRSLRKLQREGADKRAAVRAEVEAEVMAEPVNQARTFLTGPELNSDGTPADTGKLSLPAIKEIYEGNPSVDYAKLGYGKGGMLANVGIHPDIAAERFGFPSGDAMLRELLTAEPAAEKIEGLTDQRVLERYGDLSDPAEVEAAALNAIHNDLRLRVLAAEYNALAKATGRPKMLNDAARAYAREAVGRLAVKDLRQERYIAAERRAGRAAMKAMKAGDTELAASHKRAQIINAFAAQAVREAKETVDKGNNLFRRITRAKEDSTARTRNMDLVNVARAVLERYGVGTPRRAPGEYVQLLKEYDPDLYAAVEPMLVDAMLNAKPLAELQFNDFSALRDLMSQLWTLSRRARQAQIDGKAVELTEISDKLVADLANRPASFAALGATRGVTDAERGKVNFLGVRALLRRVEEWAMLQGRSFESFVFRPISQAADRYRAANADAVAAWVAELEKIRSDMKPAKIAAPELGYTFGEGNGGVGLSELLGALRHTGNDSNLRKLLVGYNWGRIDENGELDTSRWDAFLARMHREGTLKKAHWDFIQAEWDLHETIKPQAQKAHRAVYGRYFDEVTAAPVATPFGVYKGGYVAAAPDNLVGDDNAALRADAESLLGGGSALFPAPARGFTKRRTEEYATKMALDLRLVPRQIDKVLRFAYLAEPISDVVRILKEKQVASGLKANDPTAMTDLLMPWLRRSATQMTSLPPAGRGGAALDKLARIMRQRTSMALLFANLSNTLQNITGLAPAALRTGKRNMLSATWRYLRDPSGSAASVDAASVFMANRADRQMEDMRLAIEEIVLNPSPYQKTQEFFARHAQFLQSALQNVLDRIAWMAAYDRATETGSPTPEADADSVVRTTMGSFSPEDLSRFETGPAWARPLTLFAGYFISQANLAGTEFAKAAAAKNVGRGLEVWALGIAVPAIASMMIAQAFRGELGDEDEDGYLDDFLHLFFGGQASYLLAMVPVLGPTINAAILGFNDKPYDDKVSLSPVVSMAESSARVPSGAVKLAQGEGDWSRTIKDSAALATLATGIPFTLLGKPVSYAVDVMEGDIEPEGPVDATRGAITGTASPQSRE